MTNTFPVKSPKKLIEVALPLDAINAAAAREKSIRHGHPSTLHLWWARRPLAAARAVIFGQLVNDPSWKWEMESPGEIPPSHLKASWAASRKRLFGILEELVLWENTTNEKVLEKARAEIQKSWRETCELNRDHPQAAELFDPDKLPGLHDPFAGGGAIPLEAQRLGLEAFASDLNPVAVLINKAMIEIPPKFAGIPPVNPEAQARKDISTWKGAQGLADDVRYYGKWMRDEAQKRIGHLYPPVEVTEEMAVDRPDLKSLVGKKLTVIAWLWARTVKSPNPAFRHVEVPLASTFVLSSRAGREAYVEPIINGDSYRFVVKVGIPPHEIVGGTKASRGSFLCVLSNTTISYTYIDDEANAGRISQKLMAVVAAGERGRIYLPPTEADEIAATLARPAWKPETPCRGTFASNAQGRIYGFKTFGDYFTSRQLVTLTTLSELVAEVRDRAKTDATLAGMTDDRAGLESGGKEANAYAEAVSVYLALAVSKTSDYNSSLVVWSPTRDQAKTTFARQALPMVWDYAEVNTFAEAAGDISVTIAGICRSLERQINGVPGRALQQSAQSLLLDAPRIISTDPPYYDNIGYADLSDFFYVWLRSPLRPIFPGLLSTIAVPKDQELIVTPYRHGGKENAEKFFLDGMTQVMTQLVKCTYPSMPLSIYYAFKQSETSTGGDTSSTGWVTFLEAISLSGLAVTGTWPMNTERDSRSIGIGTNSLASSIVLVCRPRAADAPTTSRRIFLRELNRVLPEALDEMTKGAGDDRSPVAPVDLSQAIIGPGMAVFSKYAAVLEADGTPMSVRTALQLINRFLAEDDFDADTQFCLHWFEQNGWKDGRFGEADVLARAKGTSVEGVRQAGVIESGGGAVRLLRWSDYPADWNPATDARQPVWEGLHQLIRVFKTQGESATGALLAAVKSRIEAIRQLAYRLYTLCERAGWAEDARAYNEIVTSWSGIEAAAARIEGARPDPQQTIGFDAERLATSARNQIDPPAYAVAGETDLFGIPRQKDLFGDVVEEKNKPKK